MKIGTSTWSLGPRMDLGEKLALIRKAGFELIEAGPAPPDFSIEKNKRWMKKLLEKNNLNLYSYHSSCYLYYPGIKETISFLDKEMELACYLGAKIMVIHPIEVRNGYAMGYSKEGGGEVRKFKVKESSDEEASKSLTQDFLKEALPLTKKWGMVLTLENTDILDLESIYSIMEALHNASIGFTLDTQHAFIHSKNSLHQWIYGLREYLCHIHVGDATRSKGHRLIGSLMIDWEKLKADLTGINFSGCLMIEVLEGGQLFPKDLLYQGMAKSRNYLVNLFK